MTYLVVRFNIELVLVGVSFSPILYIPPVRDTTDILFLNCKAQMVDQAIDAINTRSNLLVVRIHLLP